MRNGGFESVMAGVCIAIIFGLLLWYEYAVWGECLKDHSWWYCMRILSK